MSQIIHSFFWILWETTFTNQEFWSQDHTSHMVIKNAWITFINGTPSFSFTRKLKLVQKALADWNRHHFGHIQFFIREATNTLSKIQEKDSNPQNRVMEEAVKAN